MSGIGPRGTILVGFIFKRENTSSDHDLTEKGIMELALIVTYLRVTSVIGDLDVLEIGWATKCSVFPVKCPKPTTADSRWACGRKEKGKFLPVNSRVPAPDSSEVTLEMPIIDGVKSDLPSTVSG
jgi:hypothetical protein